MTPNILFLMTDQQRPDHAGFMPGSKMETPHIDRIAEGTAFANCQSVNPVCMPARSALATGKHTRQIGALRMSGDLSLQHPTFMQALQRAGYFTAGEGKFHYLQTWPWGTPRGQGLNLVALESEIKQYGYDHVWEASGKQLAVVNYDHYCRALERRGILENFRDHVESTGQNSNFPSPELEKDGRPWPLPTDTYIDIAIADQVILQLKNRPKDKPFYIFGSFCSPHKPFDPPQSYLDSVHYEEIDDFIPGPNGDLTPGQKKTLWRLRHSYRACIKLVDDQVGRILQVMEEEGLLQNTVIFFTSDHGELMGDHGRVQKSAPWRQSLTVPTAIRHPDFLRGSTCTTPVELTDLTATILDIAGLDPQRELGKPWPAYQDRVPCCSLLPILRGESAQIREFSFSECADVWQCIQSERFKFIQFPTNDPDIPNEALFDLTEDPLEINNLINVPEMETVIRWHRNRLHWKQSSLLPAQQTWVPKSGLMQA